MGDFGDSVVACQIFHILDQFQMEKSKYVHSIDQKYDIEISSNIVQIVTKIGRGIMNMVKILFLIGQIHEL